MFGVLRELYRAEIRRFAQQAGCCCFFGLFPDGGCDPGWEVERDEDFDEGCDEGCGAASSSSSACATATAAPSESEVAGVIGDGTLLGTSSTLTPIGSHLRPGA